MNSTQAQRDYITALLTRIGVETAHEAGVLTIDQAIDQGRAGDEDRANGGKGYRTPREVARKFTTKAAASAAIGALKAI